MAPTAWVGVDVGTSALKIAAFAPDGSVLASYESPLRVDQPAEGRVEADPDTWLAAVQIGLATVEGALGSVDVTGIGVTGQMHGAVLVDAAGAAAGPAVLWPDRRAADQAERWAGLPAGVLARVGGPWSPGMTGPVLGWLAAHDPGRLARAERVLLAKDWIRLRLTGALVDAAATDLSDASATLLWDAVAGEWSPDAVAAATVDPGLLPGVVASDNVVGRWSPAAALVVAGAGDTPASLLALERCVGGWQPGDQVVNLGTGAQVITPTVTARPDAMESRHVLIDAGGGSYAMVAVQNAGLATDWARAQLGLTWTAFRRAAESAPAGAGGVLFAPYVSTERGALAPIDGRSRPHWPGAAPTTAAGLLARAAVEAQVFMVRRARELIGAEPGRVLLVGGGGRHRWVQQLLADCLQTPVERVELGSAAAAGAAVLAAAGAGGALALTSPTVEIEPRPAQASADAYLRWRDAMYGAAPA